MRRNNSRKKRREMERLAPTVTEPVTSGPVIPVGVVPITSRHPGRITSTARDIRISVINGGTTKAGEKRYLVSIRITEEARKKITAEDFIMAGLDQQTKRMYFWQADPDAGYKIVTNKTGAGTCGFKFQCDDKEFWNGISGSYDMRKDPRSGLQYIDYGEGR